MEKEYLKIPVIKNMRENGERIRGMAMVNYLFQTGQFLKGNGKMMSSKMGRLPIQMAQVMKAP